MKTWTHIILLLLCCHGRAVVAQSRIVFDTKSIDLGTIPKGSPAEFTYAFTNTGDSPLIISMVKSSCGCVAPHFSYEPVAPGQRGEVKAKYDSHRVGPCHKSLTVLSNDPENPTITLILKANIFPMDQRLVFSEVTSTSPFVEDPEAAGKEIAGSEHCRPCFPPPAAGQYVLRVSNPNAETAYLDLSTYNDAANDYFGAFFSEDVQPAASADAIRRAWGDRYRDKASLPPQGIVYLVVQDRDWLAEHFFRGDHAEWALPVGVTWEAPSQSR
jgi:hypothetical protein